MADQVKHYFARGNTAAGSYTLFDSVLTGLDTVFVLNGRTGAGNAKVLQELAEAWRTKDGGIHCIHEPLDSELLDAIILVDARIAVVDGNAWSSDPILEGTEIHFIQTEGILNTTLNEADSEAIAAWDQQIRSLYKEAYSTFLTTLRIHDEWEKFYIDHLDRGEADRIAEEWIDENLIPYQTESRRGVHRFLGAATSSGSVDFVPNLTEGLNTRILVKGRPGSGKSTLFKKLAAAAETRGINTEIYHCGFDPNSLDMLIFPELSIAIFDSTAPHEYFPSREGDVILDVYELAIAAGTDEKFADEIAEIRSRYTASMKWATGLLAQIKEVRGNIFAAYENALDSSAIELLAQNIIQEVNEQTQISALKDK
ncbi:hypothetical protein [Paenibacillus pini]|uniref:ATPase n=1 Tax=Paenibacillus pini JCM 16418 TaxID=1236976 RepID=W7YG53_9BACL|nr:hypothetical protein [Paenibacillus pini]GAF07452.1 ATPase [Paenibacillus pini JCM 16418]